MIHNASNNSPVSGLGDKIFLIGFMGSGKTHWGRIWAAAAGFDFYDLDELIEEKDGRSISAIFEGSGEDHFRDTESSLLRTFSEKENFLLACGGGAPCFRDNMHWMNDHGITLYLSASPRQIFEQVVAEMDKRPLLQDVKQEELLTFIEQKLKDREPFYEQARYKLMADNLNDNSFKTLNL